MLFAAVEIFGNEQPAGNGLSIGSGEMHVLRRDQRVAMNAGRHRIGEAQRMRGLAGVDHEQIRRVLRIGVLVDQLAVIRRPDRRRVRAPSRGQISDGGVSRAATQIHNAQMTIAGVIRLIGVEGDFFAVVRPSRPPGFEAPAGELHRAAASGGNHIEMIPAVAIAQKRDPFAVRRRLARAAGVARHAPELLLDIFVKRARRAGEIADQDRAPLVVAGLPIVNQMRIAGPASALKSAPRFKRRRFPAA